MYKRQHVDASKGMVTWAKENAVSSRLGDAPIRWIVDDCVKFVEREIRRGNVYDAIIMDPPSYGRGPKGEIWKIEEKIFDLIELCSKVLSDNPLFYLINSYTTGLQSSVMSFMLSTALSHRTGHKIETCSEYPYIYKIDNWKISADEIGLPITKTNQFLPCGASCRGEFNK